MTTIPFTFPEKGGELLNRRLCMTMTTTPPFSQKRMKEAVYDHDYHPFHFQEKEESF